MIVYQNEKIKANAGAAMSDNLPLALKLMAQGWYIHPCKPDKKPHTTHGKNDATLDAEQIKNWWARWPDALIGIYCEKSGIFALDIDNKSGKNGNQAWAELVRVFGHGESILAGPIQQTPSGGYHIVFKLPDNLKIPNTAEKLAPALDLRSNGYICTGGTYTWLPDHSYDCPLTNAPNWLLDLIHDMAEQKKTKTHPEPFLPNIDAGAGIYWLRYYLDRAAPGSRNQLGFELACQLRDSGIGQAEAESIMQNYAASVPGDGYSTRESIASMRSAYSSAPREAAHLPGIAASNNGYRSPNEAPKEPTPAKLHTLKPTPGAYKLDDIGNGERLARRHGAGLHYVKEWGWLTWDGKRWKQDRGEVAKMAKETARSIFAEAAEAAEAEKDELAKAIAKHAAGSASQYKRSAMIESCASEPGIPANPQQFDGDPWLLNCQNGILDLKTGELKPHDPQAFVTKMAGAEYDPGATCPRFLAFLDKVFNADQKVIKFIQRAVGYSLTGNVGEQCLFFPHGLGKNGKSVFTGTLQAVMGDYGLKTPTDTLMLRHFDNSINNDLARLAGARVVVAAELAEGKRLNESTVKDLVGGDIIAARYLHKEYFEFAPSFKLWMYGNHKPIIKGTDEGIWRRIKLIPFTVVIPESERDPNLLEKLKGELPGILAWAVRGCLAWQEGGLKTPAIVDAATAAYRAEQDILATFLEECCILELGAKVTAGELFKAYETWGGDLNKRRFSQTMAERGYLTNGRDGAGRALYHNIGLLEPEKVQNV